MARASRKPAKVNIEELRKRLGAPGRPLTQGELAEKLGGISQSTVSRMEADVSLQRGPVAVLLRRMDDEAPLVPPDREPTAA